MPLHSPKRYSFGEDHSLSPVPLRLFGFVPESIVDGPGIRAAVFVQGCPHHCPGCHNPDSHDPHGGILTDSRTVWEKIKPLSVSGVTFSGGEPFMQASALYEIGRAARERGLNVMTYSGYTAEELFGLAERDAGVKNLLTVTNYLVDGRFVLAERDLTLKFRGSRNQRILDITGYPNSAAIVAADFA